MNWQIDPIKLNVIASTSTLRRTKTILPVAIPTLSKPKIEQPNQLDLLIKSLENKRNDNKVKFNTLSNSLTNIKNLNKIVGELDEEIKNINKTTPLLTIVNEEKKFNSLLSIQTVSTNKIKTILPHNLTDGTELKISGDNKTYYVKVVNSNDFRLFENKEDIDNTNKAVRFSKGFEDTNLIYKASIQKTISTERKITITDKFNELYKMFTNALDKVQELKFNPKSLSAQSVKANIGNSEFKTFSLQKKLETLSKETESKIGALHKESIRTDNIIKSLQSKQQSNNNMLTLLNSSINDKYLLNKLA